MLLMEMLLDREPLLNGMMVGFFRGGGGAGRDPWSSGSKKVDQGRSRADAAKHQQQTKNMNLFVALAKSTNTNKIQQGTFSRIFHQRCIFDLLQYRDTKHEKKKLF